MKQLTNSQLKTIVDICVQLGTIGLGSVVIPVVLERGEIESSIFGLTVVIFFWYISIVVSKEIT